MLPANPECGGPKLLITIERGRERRVARDLLDALYPHDRGIRLEPIEGGVLVYSTLSPDELLDLLRRYPIRGLLRARRVLSFAEGSLETAVAELLTRAASQGVKLRSAEVRTRGLADKRELERLISSLAAQLGLFERGGARARVLLLSRGERSWLLVLAA